MKAADFEVLTPEEVEALSAKDRKAYDRWLDKQPEVEEDDFEVLSPKGDPNKINSVDEAIDFVKENFKIPEGTKVFFVTEDKNVFWKEHHSDAINHSQMQKLKLFTVEWTE